MLRHATNQRPMAASMIRHGKGGTAMLVASGGTAYDRYIAVHTRLAGSPIVVLEWYTPEVYSEHSDPSPTMLSPRDSHPIRQWVGSLAEARQELNADCIPQCSR